LGASGALPNFGSAVVRADGTYSLVVTRAQVTAFLQSIGQASGVYNGVIIVRDVEGAVSTFNSVALYNAPVSTRSLLSENDTDVHHDVVATMDNDVDKQHANGNSISANEPLHKVDAASASPSAEESVKTEIDEKPQAKVEATETPQAVEPETNISVESNTLSIMHSEQPIDLAQIVDNNEMITTIDMSNGGQDVLNITLDDLLTHGETDAFIADGAKQMMIQGEEGDVVNIEAQLEGTDPTDWAKEAEAVEVAGVRYEVYQNSAMNVELLVQEGVTTNLH
jgi:hypothetical protein